MTSSSSLRTVVELLRHEEAVGDHRRAHAEPARLDDQRVDVVAEQRLAAEELDAHGPEPCELREHAPVLAPS